MPTRWVRDRLMSIEEAKFAESQKLENIRKNDLEVIVTDRILGVRATLREILTLRISSDSYFLPEETRWTYREVQVENNQGEGDSTFREIGPDVKHGGRKSRRHKSRRHKSRRH